ncbi:MAG: hypothetical protein IH629_04465 [Thermoleophilia bacterium]|nr:hypothetical protein [Thermoleophilia bacterium]
MVCVSHCALPGELVVRVCCTLFDCGYLDATEGDVPEQVSGEASFAIAAPVVACGPDAPRAPAR